MIQCILLLLSPIQARVHLTNVQQTVQFSCFIEPTPPESVIYQWNTVERFSGASTHSSQNFSKTHYYYSLRYCCQVFQNQTLLGSNDKFAEVQGEFL